MATYFRAKYRYPSPRLVREIIAKVFLSALLMMGSLQLNAESLDDESMSQYISIDEILDNDNSLDGDQATIQTVEEFEAGEEFIDLNEILYGTSDEQEIQQLQSEEKQTEAPAAESLDAQMETLKQKVLAVNRDLFVLEEDLLFPSSTQVNVFVSIDPGQYFALDGVSLKIDDKAIQSHLYTEREKTALERGAVQRLYTGNIRTGEHEIVAVVSGIGPESREYRRAVSLDFVKNSGTKYIELKIVGDTLRQQPQFQLREWD